MALNVGDKSATAYIGDYQPLKIAYGDKVVADYETIEKSGESVVVDSEYKTPILQKIEGNTEQDSRVVATYEVEGKAFKYNQIVKNGDFKNGLSNWEARTSSINVEDGCLKISSVGESYDSNAQQSFNFIANHKYLYSSSHYTSSEHPRFTIYTGQFVLTKETAYSWITDEVIWTQTHNSSLLLIGKTGSLASMNIEGDYNLVKPITIIDLTDMYGAGNEPTTLEQFYATPQGKLYQNNYVEYGYHILGAGEYKSNQLYIPSRTSASNNGVNYSFDNDMRLTISGMINPDASPFQTYLNSTSSIIQEGDKFLLGITEIENPNRELNIREGYTSGQTNLICDEERFVIGTARSAFTVQIFSRAANVTFNTSLRIILRNLTALGLDNLTIDQLRAQRPDLFVYQPHHETETRYGFIFNDGTTYQLNAPLYAVGDTKDKASTSGVVNKRFGVYTFTGNENWSEWTSGSESYGLVLDGAIDYDYSSGNDVRGLCSILRVGVNGGVSAGVIGLRQLGDINRIYLPYVNSSMTTPQELKSWVATNKPIIVYKKATPTTEQLTPMVLPSGLTCVNETATQVDVQTPTPQFPEEVKFCDTLTIGEQTISGLGLYKLGDAQDVYYINSTEIENGKGKVWKKSNVGSADFDSLNWTEYLDTYHADIPDMKSGTGTWGTINGICAKYKRNPVSAGTLGNGEFCLGSLFFDAKSVAVRDTNFASADAFKSANAGTILYYEKATPEWIDLTSTTLGASLLGAVSAPNTEMQVAVDNGGKVAVKYFEKTY